MNTKQIIIGVLVLVVMGAGSRTLKAQNDTLSEKLPLNEVAGAF